jgi:aspartate/methionine/tyrosine aminotransferase
MQSYPPALLEDWMRLYYFAVDADIGSSGVSDSSLAEVRALAGIGTDEMDSIVFHDSQTLGGTGVRRAIARRWAAGDADRVMVTHGSTEAIFLVMNALLRPGDDVVVLDPVYPGLGDVVRAMGCRMHRWTLRTAAG